jgi:hypothetical protein
VAIHANADQRIDISGAVSLATAQTNRATCVERGSFLVFLLRDQDRPPRTPVRSEQLLRCQRLSRFCVLMNLTCRARESIGNLGRRNN